MKQFFTLLSSFLFSLPFIYALENPLSGFAVSNAFSAFGDFYRNIALNSPVMNGIAVLVFFAGSGIMIYSFSKEKFSQHTEGFHKALGAIGSTLITGWMLISLRANETFIGFYGGIVVAFLLIFLLLAFLAKVYIPYIRNNLQTNIWRWFFYILGSFILVFFSFNILSKIFQGTSGSSVISSLLEFLSMISMILLLALIVTLLLAFTTSIGKKASRGSKEWFKTRGRVLLENHKQNREKKQRRKQIVEEIGAHFKQIQEHQRNIDTIPIENEINLYEILKQKLAELLQLCSEKPQNTTTVTVGRAVGNLKNLIQTHLSKLNGAKTQGAKTPPLTQEEYKSILSYWTMLSQLHNLDVKELVEEDKKITQEAQRVQQIEQLREELDKIKLNPNNSFAPAFDTMIKNAIEKYTKANEGNLQAIQGYLIILRSISIKLRELYDNYGPQLPPNHKVEDLLNLIFEEAKRQNIHSLGAQKEILAKYAALSQSEFQKLLPPQSP